MKWVMQNVEWLELAGFKRTEGTDDEGRKMVVWMRPKDHLIGFGMWPDDGDTLPYIVDLADAGYSPKTDETDGRTG